MSATLAPPSDTSPSGTSAHRRTSAARRSAWLAVSLVVLGLIGVASITFGAREIAWSDVVSALSGNDETLAEAAVAKRIPRTFLAMLVGAALGVVGAVMQGLTRNPLADPGLLGITPGASLAVVVGMAFFGLGSPMGFTWVAIGGAAVAAVFVYVVGSIGRGGATPLKLTLAGAAVSAAFTSLISAVLLPRIDVMDSFRFWQIGGVGGATAERTLQVLPFLVVGALLSAASTTGLNALALGDDLAAGLGERVVRTRVVAALGSVTLCGAATALAGPIAFVGLVVPHACRLLAGLDHRWLLPSCAVVGAGLLTLADVLGRVVARPDEIDVGILTALIGAPVFIAIVRRQKARAL
ncbi:FecCD family ABC transporter permease [Agilicoccus flavus]|uniref:FecCD family ABC transporter permease n=1 Tax=Agilicoccus flavus TaxID=2775968 RepID=UPI001CF643A6|nr:iron ABC transporter permease [Agilicoccus flavus]